MMRNLLCLLSIPVLFSCTSSPTDQWDKELDYCLAQTDSALTLLHNADKMPRRINNDSDTKGWECTSVHDWTSGFWPGILWYDYEYSQDTHFLREAEKASEAMYAVLDRKVTHHDLGFMMYCSLGNGYRLTGNQEYRRMLLRTADSLAVLYNPKVGTINSWPGECVKKGWPHCTIIDNMLNLELLFWAAKNGGGEKFYQMAERHAEVTMHNQFRPDNSTCHVVVYDTITGDRIKQVTHQGYADESMWARGQGWAIYGFTMCYRETGRKDFLETACKAAELYLQRLPEDKVPYWDFDDPAIPNAPRDASAAALVASGLIELSQYVDSATGTRYLNEAKAMLRSLSKPPYRAQGTNYSFLLHSTGHKPNGYEIDASIIYADYYYIEALMRLKTLH